MGTGPCNRGGVQNHAPLVISPGVVLGVHSPLWEWVHTAFNFPGSLYRLGQVGICRQLGSSPQWLINIGGLYHACNIYIYIYVYI